MFAIYWICGGSGSGKETFIRAMEKKVPKSLENLGWKDKKIIGIESSMKYIGQYEGDPIVEKRKAIVKEVENLPEDAIALIKYQDVDEEMGTLNKVQEKFGDVTQSIIFLEVETNTLFKRCQKKSWWDEELEKGRVKLQQDWLEEQRKKLKHHRMKIIHIDSNTKNYNILK